MAEASLNIAVLTDRAALAAQVRSAAAGLPVSIVGEDMGAAARIDHLRPDVALVDAACAAPPLHEIVASIRAASPATMIVAVHDSAEPSVILSALRAGVSEFLYPPFADGLRSALERKTECQAAAAPGVRLKGKTLGFLSAKGGCGATTIASHLAVELARAEGHLVLLADLDPQNGIVRFLMKSKSPYSIMDAVDNLHRLDISYWKALVSNGHPGLEIIPGPETVPLRRLQPDQVRPVLKFVRSHYEWTVVDLGRGVDPFVIGALEEIDEACIVLTLDLPALHQAKQVLEVLLAGGYRRNRIRLVANRVPRDLEIRPEDLEKMLGFPVCAMLPEDYPALYQAYAAGKLAQPATSFGKHVAHLAGKLSGAAPAQKPKRRFSLFG